MFSILLDAIDRAERPEPEHWLIQRERELESKPRSEKEGNRWRRQQVQSGESKQGDKTKCDKVATLPRVARNSARRG